MSTFEWVECHDCGQEFPREVSQAEWRHNCVRCWLTLKAEREARATAPVDDPIVSELRADLRPLLQLTHPDRHNGSATANKITVWLLSLRGRISQQLQPDDF